MKKKAKKSKKAVKKEDKTKYDKFKVKKAKSKAKAKANAKTLKQVKKMYAKLDKPKPKAKAKVVGNFDEDSDWRLKEVHHDINKVLGHIRKSVYDLSLNDEGEHDDIVKKVQRCSDSISLLQEWIMSRGTYADVSKRLDDLVKVGADFRDRMEVIEGLVDKMSRQIDDINGKMGDPRKQVDALLQINTDED